VVKTIEDLKERGRVEGAFYNSLDTRPKKHRRKRSNNKKEELK